MHPRPTDCLACQTLTGVVQVPGGVIAENNWWLADHCLSTYGLGAVIVKTKAHRENLWDLTPEESQSLGPFLQRVSAAMVEALEAERIYVSLWVDEMPYHVHFVLQPRYSGKAELGLKAMELQVFRALQKPPLAKDVTAVAERIRQAVQPEG